MMIVLAIGYDDVVFVYVHVSLALLAVGTGTPVPPEPPALVTEEAAPKVGVLLAEVKFGWGDVCR